ncbi:pyridoxal-phosphate dependent enzyme [Streptantibioticus ferralitis]|uniref:Pyridoxal-phosphate dependent enzyme n=1 Tax=Streptantibioticus ferralitis TaxID=236510 RepID=A0ABT5Z0K0_9ACTN|nr:pyridoxal-phosphate dependent enzyme [Streptantibioticus ferralitis]MDF2256590.1 pyridoxal-phosphate dependent enzyme [Streptantibioticus ferralitis]
MYRTFAEKLAEPDLIELDDRIYVLRFEVMKVTSVYAAVKDLLARGVIHRGQTLVDSSSGIYGHALALVCRELGLKCHIFASVAVDAAIRTQLKYLGATYDQVPSSESLKHDQETRVRLVHAYLNEHPDAYWMRQYHDDVHYIGYESVAKSLVSELGSHEITLVGGVGTGASTGAMSRYLRASCTEVRVAGIQPFGSRSFGSESVPLDGFIIAGIGSGIRFDNIDYRAYDDIHWLDFDVAAAGCRHLLSTTGVFAGLSAGAGWQVARHLRSTEPTGGPIVFMAADPGHRYVDKVFPADGPLLEDPEYRPIVISDLADITGPWCTANWSRRPFSVQDNLPELVLQAS